MKSVAVMQPYFFPYLGYFQLVATSSVFVFLDDVTFIKQGWINRNRCLLQNRPHYFTVPLQSASSHRPISSTLIADDPRWRSRMLRLLEQAYAHAPFRQQTLALVERVLSAAHCNISDLAAVSVRTVCEHVGLAATWQTSSSAHPAQGTGGAGRIVNICRALGATRYVNAPGGSDLYDQRDFESEGIEIRFLRPVLPEYPQMGGPFVGGLSIIDVLMFNSPTQVCQWMQAYELA